MRDACDITLRADTPHHMFGGLLVKGVDGWDDAEQAKGAEGGFSFLAFPQGGGKVRVFGSFSLTERYRFAGPHGPHRFLDSFRMVCCPKGACIANGEPAGPLLAYINSDTWTDGLYAEGAVLVGDAAGWTDPLIAVGLSTTYRDVRIVSELLLGSQAWGPELFAPYAEERRERMRRLRFVARLTVCLDATFGDRARDRRRHYLARLSAEPILNAQTLVILGGPELAPPEIFTAEHRALILGKDLLLVT